MRGPALLLALLPLLADAQHYCDRPDRGPLPPGMSRRLNRVVDARVAESAALYCCVADPHNFTITWYKTTAQGQEQLPSTSSSFQTFVEGDYRRTLRSQRVQADDAGNYTCVATHAGARALEFTVRFNVLDRFEFVKDGIVLENEDRRIVYGRLGDRVNMTCSFFLGDGATNGVRFFRNGKDGQEQFVKSDVEEMNGKVYWQSTSRNDTSRIPQDALLCSQEKDSSRNCSVSSQAKVVQRVVTFNPVRSEDFGEYICEAAIQGKRTSWIFELREGVDPRTTLHPAFLPKLAALLTVAVLLVLALVAGARWHLELRLFCKDRFGQLEERDDKLYDIFVCYDKADTQFVLEILVRALEDNFGYSCYVWQRDTLAGDWIPEAIVNSVRRSRRFLIVISPEMAENPWCTFALHTAIGAMLELHSRIICVLLKEIRGPRSLMSVHQHPNPTLQQVLRIVRKVVWKPVPKQELGARRHLLCTRNMLRHGHILCISKVPEKEPPPAEDMGSGSARFWRRLRLHLPPRRSLMVLSKPPESPTSTKSLISLHT